MAMDATTEVELHLDEIAERLWSNKAAIMVGAGLSQNAEPVGPRSGNLPSWKELGDSFYMKLHGCPPGEDARYLSVLKLAEQVKAAFGGPALNDLLRREIPHLRYEPSALHGELLRLPWTDVFTTNYDTLLERARAQVTLMHYDVVATKEDLLYASGPRIVKLHGSLPTPPFVITEEDYRRYPSDHAPFVNTVRQSLLESTLCLLGFSGDDPNFLQWIGWIRDHVGRENSPKIYLVGALNDLSEPDRRLLDDRGIVAVDLSAHGDHRSALHAFVHHLRSRRTTALEWPLQGVEAPRNQAEERPKEYRGVVDGWRRQRMAYPGWVVPPADRRDALWNQTKRWCEHVSEMSREDWAALGAPLDLELAHELGWRLDRSLVPLQDDVAVLFRGLVEKYGDGGPGSQSQVAERLIDTVSEAVGNVRIWLMRYYREEGSDGQWKKTRQEMEADSASLLPDQRAKLRIEEALQALSRLDPATAKSLLVDWQADEHLPFWEARRAAMLAELGDGVTARSMLSSSLEEIRKQGGLNPVTDDYTLASQESIVMVLHDAVERSVALMEREPADKELTQEFNERWKELARYKCDPRRELEDSFAALLREQASGTGEDSSRHQFDLGRVMHTEHFGPDSAGLAAYRLLRIREDIGMPYRIGNVTFSGAAVKAALPRVARLWPHWALGEHRPSRRRGRRGRSLRPRVLGELGTGAGGWALREVYRRFRANGRYGRRSRLDAGQDVRVAGEDAAGGVLSLLLQVLRRRTASGSSAVLGRIYGSRRRAVFRGVRNLVHRILDSMSTAERLRAVPTLMEFPMPEGLRDYERQEFVHPVPELRVPSPVAGESFGVEPERIQRLLDLLSDESAGRDWAATNLCWLHVKGAMTSQESGRLGDLLWGRAQAGGLPVVRGFDSTSFLSLPHPDGIDPELRVKAHLQSALSKGLPDNVLAELRRSAGVVDWLPSEVSELIRPLSRWWEKNKEWLEFEMDMQPDSPAVVTRGTAETDRRRTVVPRSKHLGQ